MYRTKTKDRLSKKLPSLVLVLFILQPCMDVLSYTSDKLGISNIYTLLLRFAILAAVLISGFILSEKKKIYIITASILCIYTLCHIGACMCHGYDDPVADIANLIRIFQMPLFTLCFITFIKVNDKVTDSIRTGFVICLLIIAAVEIISVITGTNPYTYENKSIGIIGWFYDSSAQSAVLSTLVPVFAAWSVQRYRDKLPMLLLMLIFSSLILFMYATRLAYISLIMTLAGLVITLLITDRKAVKAIISLVLVCVLFICFVPLSPMEKNQSMVGDNAVKKQTHIDSLVTGEETEDLREAYEFYMGGLVGRFGLEAVAQRYNYSTKASDICDVRRMKNTYCTMLMEEQGVSAMLFGMELSDMTYDGRVHDVENDFHGIFYLTGGVGLLMLALFLFYFVFITFKALLTDFKNIFDLTTAGYGIALIASILHGYATCGVLRRPGSSFYLSAILSAIYFFTKLKKGHIYDHQK
ncbi:MAG: O-antigen ligase family protein [Clostridia bacterium]|nr:O-antigen ligase family protein [Clostridia bacterium]